MADKTKDVIYIDIDDEITSVIDKVRNSEAKILALVLPKRASVFQSIVNMKLLKRSADQAKKRLVLITSEIGLLPLAGAVGVHVAKSLQTKPEVPAGPELMDSEESIDEDTPLAGSEGLTAATAGDRPIGELAAGALASQLMTADDAMETLELDNEETTADAASLPKSDAPLTLAAKKDKKLKVPNFDRFRLGLILAGLVIIALIVLLYFALSVLPKATIAIKTNASNINSNLNLTLDVAAHSLDTSTNVVPAKQVQEQQTYTQTAAATGQENTGNKATGTVTISTTSTCTKQPNPISPGVGVSTGNLTFITTDTVTFTPAFDSNGNVVCSGNVPVKAQQAGAIYNMVANSQFAVAGYPGLSGTNGSAFSGGTDNIVKVISQADIDGAKSKISTQDAVAKQDLQNQLKQGGYYAVAATFQTGTPNVTSSANAGDAVASVTITETISYSMFGAHASDLSNLVDSQVDSQIDTSKQSILNDGLNNADIKVTNSTATTAQLSLQTTALVGPDIKIDAIKLLAEGKKSGDVKALLKSQPGVTDVVIKLSPFWVTSVPKQPTKITVTIAKPTITTNANATP